MAISHWPTAERPREKLLLRGADALSDAELLAIFLRNGYAGRSAVDLARDLLQDFGSLRGILEADAKSFCQRKGLGQAKFAQLKAALEIAQRHLAETLRDAEEKYIEFEFADDNVPSLVFDRQAVIDATEDILADNSIRKQSSPDLLDVWEGK